MDFVFDEVLEIERLIYSRGVSVENAYTLLGVNNKTIEFHRQLDRYYFDTNSYESYMASVRYQLSKKQDLYRK